MSVTAAGAAGLTSVVIVNYNTGHHLTEAVRSALSSRGPVEVVVVDNASTDGSLEGARRGHDDTLLKIVRNASNEGFARAANRGLEASRGNHLLLLNPDARLEPDTIAGLTEALGEAPDAGMAGPLLVHPDGTEQAGGRRDLPTPGRAWARALGISGLLRRSSAAGRVDFVRAGEPLPAGPTEVEAVSGACMLVRRAALERVGPLDEGYFLHCEDLDWCHRFRDAGLRVLFVPGVRVTHDKGVSGRDRPFFVQWHLHRGMVRYYRKFLRHRYPAPLFGLVQAGVWARFGVVAAATAARRAIGWRPGRASGGSS